MTDEEFLKTHGQQWARIIGMSSFNAGMIRLSMQAMERIKKLDDHEIQSSAVIILSDLRGRLRHEFELLSLPIPPEEPPPEIQEEYVNQEQEFYAEQQRIHRPKLV